MVKKLSRKELIDEYIEFFKSKNHQIIPNSPLIPENDPSVLFTTAGMHPLVPFLLGQKHPKGKRLTNVQKCIRTGDISLVGDSSHLTFFEMLGNWSLGDYFKEDAIKWSYEFLTERLGINPEKLSVTVFAGDKDAQKDSESAEIWKSLGISKDNIYFLPKADNWWGPAGQYGPCGPCTEMFIDMGKEKCSKQCKPGCPCGKYLEVWNDVFMEYNKTEKGYEKLKQKNVDTGMGVERTTAVLQGKKSVFDLEEFKPIISKIKELSKSYDNKNSRVISDHIKSSVFILSEGIIPSNLDQGYVLRRFIRKSIRCGKLIGINENFIEKIASIIMDIYKVDYPELEKNRDFIVEELVKEEERFRRTLEKGLKEFEKIQENTKKIISGKDAFLLFQSYGFPIEMTSELAKEKNLEVDINSFKKEYEEHQELSRISSEKKFKGGLSERNPETTKLHTATHILNQALREILKKDILQRGSNITPERLRFDFNFYRKLTQEELKKVEDKVNEIIEKKLNINIDEMTVEEARKKGAQAVFSSKYGDKVTVYSIGNYSVEICAGPHVDNTEELGHFKIIKEEAVAAGIRRIKAVLK